MQYDFIVVGAGSAGCAVANRLSADPTAKVLLLEAGGPDRKKEINIPGAFYQNYKTEVDWAYYTQPQPGLNGRKLFMPRGKTLGGSSSINAMIYIRGHRRDYDNWAGLGNEGWSYKEVLPYFKRAENNLNLDDVFHGQNGPLTVSNQVHPNELCKRFIEAAVDMGFERNSDFNGAFQSGFGFYQVTIKNGKRCSSAAAYIKPVLERANLEVQTLALVEKLLVNDGKVTGVSYRHEGKRIKAKAPQVILCGGAINSPQLLMLSGIGPEAELKEVGVKCRLDLPGVGKNLQDHLFCSVLQNSLSKDTMDKVDSMPNILSNVARYMLLDNGPLASNLAEAGGFIRTVAGLEAPDMQFHFVPSYFVNHGFVRPKGYGLSLCATMLQPKSSGEIILNTKNPADHPLINPMHLQDKRDLDTLRQGVLTAMDIFESAGMDNIAGGYFDEISRDEAQLNRYIKDNCEALYHPTGTCKMGIDEMAVVDPKLKVHGIEGLMVADASIMPNIVRGNTNAPAIMIGEKAADLAMGKSLAPAPEKVLKHH